MTIGVLQVELTIPGSTCLKDKRRVVNSLKDRLHREHQVSVAEVDGQDRHATAVLGIVTAASDTRYAQSLLDRILDKLKRGRDYVLTDHNTQLLTGS